MNGNPFTANYIGSTGEYPMYDLIKNTSNILQFNSSNFIKIKVDALSNSVYTRDRCWKPSLFGKAMAATPDGVAMVRGRDSAWRRDALVRWRPGLTTGGAGAAVAAGAERVERGRLERTGAAWSGWPDQGRR